jgi:hypothetical protein
MATLPTRILEIEFDAGVWTNVTADMVEVGSRRGRNRELGAFETGHYTFTLRNDGRKYDPENTAGPYYGKLRPNRRCRLRATYNAVTYPVWVGYIDRIAQVGGGPNDATAVFDASDFFKLLNRAELPPSVYAAEVADDGPGRWFRLDEPSGSTTILDSVAQVPATVFGVPSLGAAGLVVRDPAAAVELAANSGFHTDPTITPAVISGTGAFSVEFWIQATTQTTASVVFAQYTPGTAAAFVDIWVEGNDNIWFVGNGCLVFRTGMLAYVGSSVAVTDGSPHHVVCKRESDGTMRILVDGVDRSTGFTGVAATNIPSGEESIGYPSGGFVGTLQHLAIYTTALSTARAAAHNAAGRTPWNGDDPGTRLTRIFSLVATSGSYVLDGGEPALQSTDLGGTVLAYAQKVEETSLGLLFVDREGDVTFVGRNSSVTGAYLTSKATLVDDDSGAGIPYRSGDADVDEGVIVTRATVSREGSVAVTYFDAAARDEFGWLDEVHDGLLHNSDAYSLGYAQWIVNTHKTPSTRVGIVALELTKDPAAMYPAILGLELGDRVTFKRKPQNTGAVFTQDMRVEAISHDTGAHYWRTRLQLSPFNLAAGGLPVGVWDVTNWDQSVWGI